VFDAKEFSKAVLLTTNFKGGIFLFFCPVFQGPILSTHGHQELSRITRGDSQQAKRGKFTYFSFKFLSFNRKKGNLKNSCTHHETQQQEPNFSESSVRMNADIELTRCSRFSDN